MAPAFLFIYFIFSNIEMYIQYFNKVLRVSLDTA